MEVLSKQLYDKAVEGISMFTDSLVEIIGEQTVKLEDDRVVEQYLYNIVGHTPKNGLPYVSLKANIILR